METLNSVLTKLASVLPTNNEMAVLRAYNSLSLTDLRTLVAVTKQVAGVSFVGIKNYKSLNSNETEIANYTINVGASYENMLRNDEKKLQSFNVDMISDSFLNDWNYSSINYTKFGTFEAYKQAVKNSVTIALSELIASATKSENEPVRESNDVWLSKLLAFNTSTQRLSIIGVVTENGKKTLQVGERKLVAKAPKTTAKEMIKHALGMRTSFIRRFVLENMNTIRINGDEVAID